MNDILLYENIPAIDKNFQVKIEYGENRNGLNPHWHEHLELLFFVGDGCEMCCDGEKIRVYKDDLVVVNSNEIHSFTSPGTVEHFFVLIWPEFFKDVDFENVILKMCVRNDSFVKQCILNMYREYTEKGTGYDMQIKAYAYSLMAHLKKNYTKEIISERDLKLKNTKMTHLNEILDYISKNYKENITTASIADRCYLNKSYLCRFFKKNMGMSLTEYINKIRVEKAAVLLKNTDESITDIALNVGFSDLNYFSRIFKKVMNCTPKEYKK